MEVWGLRFRVDTNKSRVSSFGYRAGRRKFWSTQAPQLHLNRGFRVWSLGFAGYHVSKYSALIRRHPKQKGKRGTTGVPSFEHLLIAFGCFRVFEVRGNFGGFGFLCFF